MSKSLPHTEPPRRYTLDCMHVLWLRPPPRKDDSYLWCSKCGCYQPLLLSAVSTHGVLYDSDGEFWSERVGAQFRGGCLYIGRDNRVCEFTHETAYSWDALRNKLHAHYMRDHTRFGTLEIVLTDHPPKNSQPDF